MVEPFRRLLYEISKELSNQDLEDLIFICKVPSSVKKDIKDGKDLFKHLEERGFVSEQKIDCLRDILQHLRPTRRDLFRLINEYQRSNTDSVRSNTDPVRSNTLSTVASDATSFSLVSIDGSSVTDENNSDNRQTAFCIVDCVCIRYHGCTIMKPFCCCYGTAIFLLFVLLIAVVFWFAGKPRTVYEYLNANEYRKDIGIIVIGILCFLLVVVILPYLLRKHWNRIFKWCGKKKHQRPLRKHKHRKKSIGPDSNVPNGGRELTNLPLSELSVHVNDNRALINGEEYHS